ncbi:hypothetical protein [Tsukamurella soli]|uniref:Uncharacterized protein n=1 Tax=Tsukamurella soli TaxID=644556 RepID=A0ABP8JFV7_9ACTN
MSGPRSPWERPFEPGDAAGTHPGEQGYPADGAAGSGSKGTPDRAAGSDGDAGNGGGDGAADSGHGVAPGAAPDGYSPAQYSNPSYPQQGGPGQYPGSQYPYPSGQYPSAQYPAGLYQSAQYPAGQYQSAQYPSAQYPSAGGSGIPQWPGAGGPGAPGGEPPKRSRTGLWIGAGVTTVLVVLVIIAVVVGLVHHGASASVAGAPDASTAPSGAGVDSCGLPGTGASAPITDFVTSGPLSFPVSAAPGWTAQTYVTYAQSRNAAGLVYPIVGQQWQAGAEIGETTFTPTIKAADAATRMVACIAAGAGYKDADPHVANQSAAAAIKVDGVDAAKVTADIRVSRPGLSVEGDHLTVIVVETAPQTYLLTDTPIGDSGLAAVAQAIADQLRVAKDV